MKSDKYILRIKQLIFIVITITLFCVSCVNDDFNPNVNLTEDVVIANEIETSIKATGIICREVEIISDKMKMGQALGVIINEERNEWEYDFNADLLSGKVVVGYPEQNENGNETKNIDCSKLKIHYYENIWIFMYGSLSMENIGTYAGDKKYNIKTKEFGYADTEKSTVPNIMANSEYVADYILEQENEQVIFSGSSDGYNQLSGDYKQSITKNIVIEMPAVKIIKGKMNISIDKYGENFPIEVEYSEQGRTIKYKGYMKTTYYDN
ncbi:MAG: hypothetical protein LBP63_09580 [Prevotellaceae bacterium]|nr:hypothetical protein [Prevotellaceae bacterium]